MPRGLAAALRHGSVAAGGGQAALGPVVVRSRPRGRAAQVPRPFRPGTRPSSTSTPGRAVRGQNEEGKCSRVPGRRVDRLLQVHAAMDVAQEHLRDPLVLLVAARRAPGACTARRRACARVGVSVVRGRLPGASADGMALSSQNIWPRVPTGKPSSGIDRRAMQPAARRRGRDHVAVAVDDVEMHRVAAASAPMRADRRLAGAARAPRRRARAVGRRASFTTPP